jgi:Tfp pilus assembly protein PilN
MRPVNLLPPEERRGGHAPMRTGAMPYVVLGALVLLLVGIVAVVLTGNEVTERENEVTTLKRENARESVRADRLAAYTQFHNLQEQRLATIRGLADSRFDWERVMRELALILPDDVWLVEMAATASPEASTGGGGGDSGLRANSPGPALELDGCAVRQDAVAGFVTALKDIDGVTRVGVQLSELPGGGETTGSEGGEGEDESGNTECRTREYIAKFELVVVFDAAPVAPEEGAEAAAATEVATSTSEGESSEEGEGG